MIMKKIVWITEDAFVDCDIIPIDQVSKKYVVDWIVIHPLKKSRYDENEIKQFHRGNNNIRTHLFYEKYGAKDIRKIIDYFKLGKQTKKYSADLYYVNYSVALPWYIFFWRQLPSKKVITAHQGAVHAGMKNKWLSVFSRDLVYRGAKFVNMFSKSQAELFKHRYKKSTIKIINLALKDYGLPSVKNASSADDTIYFLSFGLINYAKNIDLFIDAACNLYDKGVRGFKVMIYGKCQDWSFYERRIRYPELFELGIDFVKNKDIPNLFSKAHYFVQPYRVVSQSGAMKVAFQYNTPVIASNLPGLVDELEEGVNGYFFDAGNISDLERVMSERIELFKTEYNILIDRMKQYTEEHYSPKHIGGEYLNMFDNTLNY